MSILTIETARVFKPLLLPARDKAAHGGRGSAKSHHFATQAAKRAYKVQGSRIVCIREIQKSLKESAKRLIEDKIEEHKLQGFRILNDEIVTPGRGVIIFQGMQDHSAESIKSLEAFDVSWVEEAQTLSERSFQMLRPTIRKPGSERWWSWNPRRKTDPVDAHFRGNHLKDKSAFVLQRGSVVVRTNWRDNPWFPRDLAADREYDEVNSSDTYDHVWEGDYVGVQKGAYYGSYLSKAKTEGRIGRVAGDPLQAIRVYCDLGGSSGTADAFTMWVVQFVGREIRVLNYYEAVGQAAATHFKWLRDNDYEGANVYLPHDGTQQHGPSPTTWEGAFKSAGWPKTEVIDNQGKGAAGQRIEAGRRMFPSIWFNEATTQAGRDALGWYHERKDETRQIGLGPEHDWSSHAADAFGLMCMAYEAPKLKLEAISEREVYTVGADDTQGWLRA